MKSQFQITPFMQTSLIIGLNDILCYDFDVIITLYKYILSQKYKKPQKLEILL